MGAAPSADRSGPRGVRVGPGASGIVEYADLSRQHQQSLLNGMQQLERQFGRRYEEKIQSVQIQSFEILRAQRIRGAFRAVVRVVRAVTAWLLVSSDSATTESASNGTSASCARPAVRVGRPAGRTSTAMR